MSRRGITTLELVTVIAILGVVASLLYPIFGRAKEQARQSSCISNLSQLYKGLEIYRSDNDGIPTGSPSQMGLPPLPLPEFTTFKCSGVTMSGQYPYRHLWQGWLSSDPQRTWSNFVAQYQSDTPIVLDINHNSQSVPLYSPYFHRVGLVLYLDGSVKKQQRGGDVDALLTWKK